MGRRLETMAGDKVTHVCQAARDELVACLLRTDCVIKSGKTPQECMKARDELPLQCQYAMTNFTDCKKGLLDMRRRFRGNHLSDKAMKGDQSSIGIMEIGPETGAEKR
ncbi:cytochrome c oxidase assembly protein PET191-domain-containing protein [Naematelia encephala]|uniref:Cytochrome c oxidase assembly protein PET191-domain-containing protein n=1 Tax=Naematelia encephala TaxID=71784 RepID=A0A1Y2B7K8_9TREE|nr:cytochrome c oxidase assembly protein PET191-domain-containing protein [Naematelia encephala]